MARKVKFPLKMADGEEVRTLDALKEHFDVESVVGYFSDGRLLRWLNDRYYEAEAEKVRQLTKGDSDLPKKLCAIFGVESEDEVDAEEIAWRQERLNRLKQYTFDEKILERVDLVAFDQEDLGDLLDEDKPLIYLCNNRFTIPLRKTHKTYVGIGKAVAVIYTNKVVDFDKLNIKFKNIRFDDGYEEILKRDAQQKRDAEAAAFPKKLYDEGEAAFDEKDYKTALEKFKHSAELGYPKAFAAVGGIYFFGHGVDTDIDEARRWLKNGMLKNDGSSFGYYALTFDFDIATDAEKREAFNCMKTATELGTDEKADEKLFWRTLGDMYREAIGTEENLGEAFHCYEKSSAAGSSTATNLLGVMYHKGFHVTKNYDEAFKLYKKAVEMNGNNAAALTNLAYCYENARGVEKNLVTAFELYRRAAELGDVDAIKNLARAYRKGLGTSKNPSKAIELYSQAANADDIDAMVALGRMFRDGDGVTQDFFMAAKYFKQAADAGDGDSMNRLGLMYDFGQGVKEDKKLAFQWFLRSAQAGSLIGMANAGYCYLLGNGTEKNLREAKNWLKQSAEGGNIYGMLRYAHYLFNVEQYEAALNWYKIVYDKSVGVVAGEAAYGMGNVYKKVGEAKKSGGFVRKAVEIFFPLSKFAFDLVNSEGKDDLKEADRWFKKAKQLGYQPSGCFITTAVCENFGKPDDCYELTAFRNFRDSWLIAQPDGKNLIAEYYAVAPQIVDKINRRADAAQIYEDIRQKFLSPCLSLIERGENLACKKLYVEMVTSLKKKFLDG